MSYIRAGILPYIIDNKKRYYLFGVDRDYLTLMDFGAGWIKDPDQLATRSMIAARRPQRSWRK